MFQMLTKYNFFVMGKLELSWSFPVCVCVCVCSPGMVRFSNRCVYLYNDPVYVLAVDWMYLGLLCPAGSPGLQALLRSV